MVYSPGVLSESEAELDGEHNSVELPQKMTGTGNTQNDQSAIRYIQFNSVALFYSVQVVTCKTLNNPSNFHLQTLLITLVFLVIEQIFLCYAYTCLQYST